MAARKKSKLPLVIGVGLAVIGFGLFLGLKTPPKTIIEEVKFNPLKAFV